MGKPWTSPQRNLLTLAVCATLRIFVFGALSENVAFDRVGYIRIALELESSSKPRSESIVISLERINAINNNNNRMPIIDKKSSHDIVWKPTPSGKWKTTTNHQFVVSLESDPSSQWLVVLSSMDGSGAMKSIQNRIITLSPQKPLLSLQLKALLETSGHSKPRILPFRTIAVTLCGTMSVIILIYNGFDRKLFEKCYIAQLGQTPVADKTTIAKIMAQHDTAVSDVQASLGQTNRAYRQYSHLRTHGHNVSSPPEDHGIDERSLQQKTSTSSEEDDDDVEEKKRMHNVHSHIRTQLQFVHTTPKCYFDDQVAHNELSRQLESISEEEDGSDEKLSTPPKIQRKLELAKLSLRPSLLHDRTQGMAMSNSSVTSRLPQLALFPGPPSCLEPAMKSCNGHSAKTQHRSTGQQMNRLPFAPSHNIYLLYKQNLPDVSSSFGNSYMPAQTSRQALTDPRLHWSHLAHSHVTDLMPTTRSDSDKLFARNGGPSDALPLHTQLNGRSTHREYLKEDSRSFSTRKLDSNDAFGSREKLPLSALTLYNGADYSSQRLFSPVAPKVRQVHCDASFQGYENYSTLTPSSTFNPSNMPPKEELEKSTTLNLTANSENRRDLGRDISAHLDRIGYFADASHHDGASSSGQDSTPILESSVELRKALYQFSSAVCHPRLKTKNSPFPEWSGNGTVGSTSPIHASIVDAPIEASRLQDGHGGAKMEQGTLPNDPSRNANFHGLKLPAAIGNVATALQGGLGETTKEQDSTSLGDPSLDHVVADAPTIAATTLQCDLSETRRKNNPLPNYLTGNGYDDLNQSSVTAAPTDAATAGEGGPCESTSRDHAIPQLSTKSRNDERLMNQSSANKDDRSSSAILAVQGSTHERSIHHKYGETIAATTLQCDLSGSRRKNNPLSNHLTGNGPATHDDLNQSSIPAAPTDAATAWEGGPCESTRCQGYANPHLSTKDRNVESTANQSGANKEDRSSSTISVAVQGSTYTVDEQSNNYTDGEIQTPELYSPSHNVTISRSPTSARNRPLSLVRDAFAQQIVAASCLTPCSHTFPKPEEEHIASSALTGKAAVCVSVVQLEAGEDLHPGCASAFDSAGGSMSTSIGVHDLNHTASSSTDMQSRRVSSNNDVSHVYNYSRTEKSAGNDPLFTHNDSACKPIIKSSVDQTSAQKIRRAIRTDAKSDLEVFQRPWPSNSGTEMHTIACERHEINDPVSMADSNDQVQVQKSNRLETTVQLTSETSCFACCQTTERAMVAEQSEHIKEPTKRRTKVHSENNNDSVVQLCPPTKTPSKVIDLHEESDHKDVVGYQIVESGDTVQPAKKLQDRRPGPPGSAYQNCFRHHSNDVSVCSTFPPSSDCSPTPASVSRVDKDETTNLEFDAYESNQRPNRFSTNAFYSDSKTLTKRVGKLSIACDPSESAYGGSRITTIQQTTHKACSRDPIPDVAVSASLRALGEDPPSKKIRGKKKQKSVPPEIRIPTSDKLSASTYSSKGKTKWPYASHRGSQRPAKRGKTE